MCNYVAYNRFYKRRFLHLFIVITDWWTAVTSGQDCSPKYR